jgi:hypothetical protein
MKKRINSGMAISSACATTVDCNSLPSHIGSFRVPVRAVPSPSVTQPRLDHLCPNNTATVFVAARAPKVQPEIKNVLPVQHNKNSANDCPKPMGMMSETTARTQVAKWEKDLERVFATVEFVGELKFSPAEYTQSCEAVRAILQEQRTNLTKIPNRVFMTLLVFCARYEDTSATGFWAVFLQRLGLRNDGVHQHACRQRFYEAQQNLASLYFPADGYACLTPISFHAIIPQVCVPEMVSLLRQIGQGAGWDAVADLEISEIERQLQLAASKMRMTKAVCRFVSDTHSRRLAAQLVQDLCEAAHLQQRGVFLSQQIDCLLEDRPVQREVWSQLMAADPTPEEGAGIIRSLFVTPRWQWDVKARQMRLYFPRQNVSSARRPTAFVVGPERFPVQAQQREGRWEIAPMYLARLPLHQANSLKVELRDENDACLHRWKVAPLEGKVLFFQLNAAGTLATHTPLERGLPSGEWLFLLRKDCQLQAAEDVVKPLRQYYPPRYFENYQALLAELAPPLQVLVTDVGKEEAVERIPLAEGVVNQLRLEGEFLLEADDPSGTATFTGSAPEVILTAQSWDEIRHLQLQIRNLTATCEEDEVAQLYSLQNLRQEAFAIWSEAKQQLRIQLQGLLPPNTIGRFRLKLLRGLQSAQYLPLEFNLVPALHLTPSSAEIASTLYTAEDSPHVQVNCATPHRLTSSAGKLISILPGLHEIQWTARETEFVATLDFVHFQLPLRWHPHILRARLHTQNSSESWDAPPPTFQVEKLSFRDLLTVEGIVGAEYQLFAGEVKTTQERFKESSLTFSLVNFIHFVNRSTAQQVPIRIVVNHQQRTCTLLLLIVTKASVSHFDNEGEPIRYLRVGQQVFHPDYGLGALEEFTDTIVGTDIIPTAQFHFDRYLGVRFLIPIQRHLPVHGSQQRTATSAVSIGQSRKFTVGEKAQITMRENASIHPESQQ